MSLRPKPLGETDKSPIPQPDGDTDMSPTSKPVGETGMSPPETHFPGGEDAED
jgi:hypothetical protein